MKRIRHAFLFTLLCVISSGCSTEVDTAVTKSFTNAGFPNIEIKDGETLYVSFPEKGGARSFYFNAEVGKQYYMSGINVSTSERFLYAKSGIIVLRPTEAKRVSFGISASGANTAGIYPISLYSNDLSEGKPFLSQGRWYYGPALYSSPERVYFDVVSGRKYFVYWNGEDVSSSMAYPKVSAFDGSGSAVFTDEIGNYMEITAASSGRWFITITSNNMFIPEFLTKLRVIEEHDGSPTKPIQLTSGIWVNGITQGSTPGDECWYYFDSIIGSSYKIFWNSLSCKQGKTAMLNIAAYKTDLKTGYWELADSPYAVSGTSHIEGWPVTSTGTRVYIRVSGKGKGGSYAVKFE